MRVAYDKDNHGLLLQFGDPSSYSQSKEVVPGIVVDFDDSGRPLAIEVEDVRPFGGIGEASVLVNENIAAGSDLRAFREQLGMTQEQLGGALEIPRNTIARWERGELPIEKSRMLSLALQSIMAQIDELQQRINTLRTVPGENPRPKGRLRFAVKMTAKPKSKAAARRKKQR